MAATRDWSALPMELLELISNRLTFSPDTIRFRSVCTSWRSAARKRPQLPWLIGHRKDDDANQTIFSFHTLSPSIGDGDGNLLPIPQLPEPAVFGRMRCRGSSHGWMALLDVHAPSIVLWNPLTGSKIQLPTLPYFPDFNGCKYSKLGDDEYVHTFFSGKEGGEVVEKLSSKEMEHRFPNQVVLSSDPAASPSDYMVAAVCVRHRRLMFLRAGDDAWTVVSMPEFRRWSKGALFHKGKFYFTAYDAVYACVFGSDKGSRVERIELASKHGVCRGVEAHLVESDGDLLLVGATNNELSSKRMYWFRIFELRWRQQENKLEVVESDGLGDKALFLGRNLSYCVTASKFPGCKANHVYYYETDYENEDKERSFIGVCDVNVRPTVRVPDVDDRPHPDWKPCAWFTPSLLQGKLESNN